MKITQAALKEQIVSIIATETAPIYAGALARELGVKKQDVIAAIEQAQDEGKVHLAYDVQIFPVEKPDGETQQRLFD